MNHLVVDLHHLDILLVDMNHLVVDLHHLDILLVDHIVEDLDSQTPGSGAGGHSACVRTDDPSGHVAKLDTGSSGHSACVAADDPSEHVTRFHSAHTILLSPQVTHLHT